MANFRRNINGILGTILFHLVVVVVCLVFKINTLNKPAESYIIIDPQEMLDENEEAESSDDEPTMTDSEIAEYMQNLGNTGSNYSGSNSYERSSSSMSAAEMQAKYEEAFLREKYGADYENAVNSTYEDFIDEARLQQHEAKEQKRNVVKAGPALVYVELDNSQREVSYLKVPVFTCEGSGVVEIRIAISSSGRVTTADVIKSELTSDADCLVAAAKNAAMRSSFSNISGNRVEGGKITYTFVKQ